MHVDVDALLQENAAQRAQLAEVIATNTKLVGEIAKLNDRVAELLAIAQRKQRKTTTPAEKKPEAPPAVAADAQRAFEARPKPPALPEKTKPSKGGARRTGRSAIPAHLEAEEHRFRPTHCEHCGSEELNIADEVVEEKLHVVKEHQRRRVVRRTTCRCRTCLKRSTPASLPAPYARSKVTCEWLAWFIDQKFKLLSPLDRIRRDLAEREIHLAMGTLVSFVERAADLLAPIDGLHWKKLLSSSWMATDGTGLKVLVPGLPNAHDGYVELYRNAECAVFQYAAHKGSEDVVAKLAPFRGTLTADAEHRFNAVYATGRVIEAGCNAHGRRKFRDAESTQPVLAKEGGAFIAAMYVAEEDARKNDLVGDALLAHRRDHIRPIADAFAKWLAAVEPTLLPSDPLTAAVGYYRKHWDALTRFIDDAQVPIDNSPTEREFQNFAKLRLNMLFAGSSEGAHRACVLLGIVATCRAIGVPVQAYLAWAFERLGTHREKFGLPLEQITPAAFKAARG
ncbi:MAG TPA: IS66 family transposase [Candidatus Limnocylindria bacterium]|nr:IS66 family transposase [Candidatus Limnocylindria bacterium]